MLQGGLQLCLALTLFGACFWCSYPLAIALTGSARTSIRWSATAIVGSWLLVALFYVLAASGAFRWWSALTCLVAGAALVQQLIARRVGALALLRQDLARARDLLRALLRSPLRWIVLCALAILGLRLLRGLVAPPIAWDSLVYHLLKAGRWVQAGAMVPELAPDLWPQFEHFPPVGHILWAWAMLPVRGDLLLAPAGLLIWLCCFLGAYACARSLGARAQAAALAGLALALTPAVFNYLTSAYVNNTVLALFLLGAVFVGRAWQRPAPGHAALAAAALGLAAGSQLSALPLLCLAGVFLTVSLARAPLPWPRRLSAMASSLLVAAVALPGYLRAWATTGSPLFPFPLTLGGKTLLAGDPENIAQFARPRPLPNAELLDFLFLKRYWEGAEHLNFGPASIATLLLGLGGALWLLRQKETRGLVTFLLMCSTVLIAGLMSDGMAGQRSVWAPVAGRFLTPVIGGAAALAAAALGAGKRHGRADKLCTFAFAAILMTHLAYIAPQGWSLADVKAIIDILWPLAIACALAGEALLRLWRRERPVLALAAAGAILVLVVGVPLTQVRARHRYPIFAAAAQPWVKGNPWSRSYDVHGVYLCYESAWPIWRYLDDGRPHRIAASAGADRISHPWYRYPLLGSQLQNEVVYVPITRDGSLVNGRLRDQLRQRADAESWLRRLVEQRIEFFVALHPAPWEERWIRQHPTLFEQVAVGEQNFARAYRFHREAALARQRR